MLSGKPGKWTTNILAVFLSVAIIAAQISAMGYLFNYFLGMPRLHGVMIGFGVLVTYSLFGGIRAVALTDSFQGLVLLVAIPVACTIALHEIGGYEVLLEKLPATHTSIDWSGANIILMTSLIFYTLMPITAGTFIQRFLMANDGKQLHNSLKFIACISLPFTLVICLMGFIAKVKAPDIDSNTAFFYLIDHYLPVGIKGLLITGILAAIMSTADSWLNTTSVLCAHDIAKGLFPNLTDKQELLIARLAVLIISTLAMFLASTWQSLMGLIWFADNLWNPVLLVPLIAGFLGFQTNQNSFMAGAISGALGTLTGRYITGEFATVSLLLGITGNAIGLFGMHYWQVLNNKYLVKNIFSKYSEIDDPKRENI